MISKAIEDVYTEVNKSSVCFNILKSMPNIEIYILNRDGTLYDMFGDEAIQNRKIDDTFSITKVGNKIVAYRRH